MKRILCLIMIFAMAIGCLAGCGKKYDPNKKVTLKWVMSGPEPQDSSKVMAKANEMLETLLPNTKIDIVVDSSMASKWSLWMAGKQKFDIAHAGFDTNIQTEINNGSYLPLNDYIDEYAPTLKELSQGIYKDLFSFGTYKGELYAIPCIQTYVKETLDVSIPSSLRQYMDVEKLVEVSYASSTTTNEFWQILDDYLQKSKAAGAIGNDKVSNYINAELVYEYAKRGYEFIGGQNSSIAYKLDADEIELVDFHETQEFKDYIKWVSKWYAEGFVSPDVLTGGTSGSKMYLIESHLETRFPEREDHTSEEYAVDYEQDRTRIYITNPEHDYKGSSILGTYQTFLAIPSTSEAPERAVQFLDLIYSEKGRELANLLTYGFEGEQYEKVSENAIKAFEYEGQPMGKVSYGISPWRMGNMFNLYAVSPYTEETIEYAKNYFENTNQNRPQAASYGMSFDVEKYKRQLADMASVNQEYELQLTSGVYTDYTDLYNKMNSLNEKAGIKDMIKDLQKQADDFLAKK